MLNLLNLLKSAKSEKFSEFALSRTFIHLHASNREQINIEWKIGHIAIIKAK